MGHSHERTQRPCPPAVHGGLAPPTAGGAHHPRSTCTYATSAGVKMPLSPAISRPRAATSRPASLLMIAAVLPRSTCQAWGVAWHVLTPLLSPLPTLNVCKSLLLMPSMQPARSSPNLQQQGQQGHQETSQEAARSGQLWVWGGGMQPPRPSPSSSSSRSGRMWRGRRVARGCGDRRNPAAGSAAHALCAIPTSQPPTPCQLNHFTPI